MILTASTDSYRRKYLTMHSRFGKNLTIEIYGGSHEPEIGVKIRGLPIGTEIDSAELYRFMQRRMPGNSPFTTKRKEPDVPVPVYGISIKDSAASPDASCESSIFTITDSEIAFKIENTDRRSSDYKTLRTVPRPGHADYTARLRYGDSLNMAGGGPFSARMTAPLCIAGGIALQILKKQGIHIGAHIYSISDIKDIPFDPMSTDSALLSQLSQKNFAVISEEAGVKMQERIRSAMSQCDSLGGIIEVCASGLPGGIGGAMYDGIESALAPIFFGIPAVKGVEFGIGFAAAELTGSVNNDPFMYSGDKVVTATNNCGGILGGITTGMPLIARLAFKPTPSIGAEQDSVDLDKKTNTKLIIKGRHDPCVAVRAVPITEAALALGILDCMMEEHND